MIYFMIRHKATGEFMPELVRRGYTHWNPTTGTMPNNLTGCPRLIKSRKSAQACIVQWACLPNAKEHHSVSYYGEDDLDLSTKPDGRSKDDLEVVEVNIEVKV